MGSTLDFISRKFDLDLHRKSPIVIEKINREIMAQVLCELGSKTGVEVGVAQGEHAEILCKHNPDLRLYCVDPWTGYRGYRDYLGSTLNRFYGETKQRLAPYKCVLMKKFSMEAVKDFSDGYLDFVYIDGAHDFKSVAEDIYDWSPKVRTGGIVFGHDFKRDVNPQVLHHVQDVVGAYMYALGVNPWFVLGQAGKADGLYREGTRSWMYVRGEHAD
jgi:hypothetical protein